MTAIDNTPDIDIDRQARILWDYLQLHQTLRPCDAIFVLCSLDIRVAEYAAQLYKQGLGKYIIFSGSGVGRITEKLFDATEAETFADIAIKAGAPERDIIIEKNARNTGENIRFTYALLQQKGLAPQSLLLVQKPYMERRAYATFKKQWPEPTTAVLVTSPRIDFDAYFDAISTRPFVIEAMVGDLQRITLYAAQGLQIPQEIPGDVQEAYKKLIAAGYTRRLIEQK